MHSREIVFEPLDAQNQREAGSEPVILRAKKELEEPGAGWLVWFLFYVGVVKSRWVVDVGQGVILIFETRISPGASRSYRATMGYMSSHRRCTKLFISFGICVCVLRPFDMIGIYT
jgi:hypothetical protein